MVLTNKVKLTADAMKGATALKMIGVLATGYDVVDVQAARALGVPVCNVPGYAAGGVTESVFAFLLEMTRRTYQSTARIRQGERSSSSIFRVFASRTTICMTNTPFFRMISASL